MDQASEAPAVTRDPVCGMTVDPDAGKPSAEHHGRTFHFCSQHCRKRFTDDPDAYVTATDPVCGMQVDRATSRHMTSHKGTRFHFCSARCRERFKADPEAFLGDAPPAQEAPRARSGPARCTPRSSATNPATARSAAWRWSR